MRRLMIPIFLLYFFALAIPVGHALSRTIQIEPMGFILRRMNMQYEMQTSPQRSLLVDGALSWDNSQGEPTYLAVGGGLRKYLTESFVGPWFGGKVQFIGQDDSNLRASLLAGFKRVEKGGITQEFFVGARIDKLLSQEDSTIQVNPTYGYTVGFSF